MAGLADYGEPQVAHALPVLSGGGVYLHQDVREEGHTPQQGDAVGGVRLRVEGGEQQQVLAGEFRQLPVLVIAAEGKFQGIFPLLDLHIGGVAVENRSDLPAVAGQHQLAHPLAAGQHGVQIAVQEGLDPPLALAGGDPPQEFHQLPLNCLIPAAHREASHQPDNFQQRRVYGGDGLPDLPVQGNLRLLQGDVAVQHPEGVALPVPNLDGPAGKGRGGGLFLPFHFTIPFVL